jgi:hypothetical protein
MPNCSKRFLVISAARFGKVDAGDELALAVISAACEA